MRNVVEDSVIIKTVKLINIYTLLLSPVSVHLPPVLNYFNCAYTGNTDKQPLFISSYLILSGNLDMTQLKSIEGQN